jgi:hypothetical protein
MKLTATIFVLVMLIFTVTSVFAQPTEDFDIYIHDVKSGINTRVTSIPGAGEFNPSFSNNGKMVVHDVLTATSHALYITDVHTGDSNPLAGGDGGNDASWSPNGKYIAFDRLPVGDLSIYILPADGGTPQLIRANGIWAEWSNNSQRLVFTDVTDGSVRTIDINTGAENTVSTFGLNPSWSPNGKYIAYGDNNNLYVVPVSEAGIAQSAPVQVTAGSFFDQQPSWSNNGKNIVFHSNRPGGFDFDLWTVSLKDGSIERLTGQVDAGDFDPVYSKNGQYVAYAGYTAPAKPVASDITENLIPAEFELQQNAPNPFNPTTVIPFTLAQSSNVKLRIYSMNGALVKELYNGTMDAGSHRLVWDATDQTGGQVSSGVYIYQLQTEGRATFSPPVLIFICISILDTRYSILVAGCPMSFRRNLPMCWYKSGL